MKLDLYDTVTARIITQLEAGIAPWVCPWNNSAPNIAAMPRNATTGRAYSGVNILLLWLAQADNGFQSADWLTFKQAQAIGAQVRKGERGTQIVFADAFIPKSERARAARENRDPQSVKFLKGFHVFNRYQIEGLAPASNPLPVEPVEQNERGEALIAASGADFRQGGNRAFYSPGDDFVQVPHPGQFNEPVDYYRTAAHELAHWTGHPSRLARNLLNSFGSKDYAREELVAEMGAAFVCAALGIEPSVRHADYLGSWLQVLREDNRAIFRAASAASHASDYLLSRMN